MINSEELDKRDRRLNLRNLADSILELLDETDRLEQINKEHQELNGELQEKLTELEKENKRLQEIIDGKAVQEMGTSNLYKED